MSKAAAECDVRPSMGGAERSAVKGSRVRRWEILKSAYDLTADTDLLE